MEEKSQKWLADIRHHADFITRSAAERSIEGYRTNEMFRLAVERSFEIIGEALNRLLREDPGIAQNISYTSAIIGFRNILAHGYDIVDEEMVWNVISEDVPKLLIEVEVLLDKGKGS